MDSGYPFGIFKLFFYVSINDMRYKQNQQEHYAKLCTEQALQRQRARF